MKSIILILLAFLLFFGCTNQNTISADEMTKIQEEYAMKEAFIPDRDIINSYISELSLLRGKIIGPSANVIEAEIYSAQSFYYLDKAFEESSKINYSKNVCNSQEYNNTLKYLQLSKTNSLKANEKMNLVVPTNTYLLRENQSQIVNGFYVSADEYKKALEELC